MNPLPCPGLRWAAIVLLAWGWTVCGGAADDIPADAVRREFFEKRIRPVLARHCYKCHSAAAQPLKAGLRLDRRSGWERGGKRGSAVHPGDPNRSLLLQALRHDGLQMPPAGRLPRKVIQDFETWIAHGAYAPAEAAGRTAPAEASADGHWSLQPLKRPNPPHVVRSAWVRNPIDAFVLARLEAAGIEPARRAEPEILIRRAHLRLWGLPPAPDSLPDRLPGHAGQLAFERLVDRLLASPHYGERQARQWMDVVRYSETAGHVQDLPRPNAWRYRDWLIDAFNQDLPYDRFILEHVAGDLITPRFDASGRRNLSPVATGWMWFSEMHFRPVDPAQQRADQVDAQIDVFGKAFQGLTIACARCHEHKFDPITQADYFALAGVFRSTIEENRYLVSSADLTRGSTRAQRNAIAGKQQAIAQLIREQTAVVRRRQSHKTRELLPVTEINFGPGPHARLVDLRTELARLSADSVWWAPVARDWSPRDARLPADGHGNQPGRRVPRAFLSRLAPERIPPLVGSGRLYLARQLVSQRNPLTARVMVNRLWQRHFGRGLVATPNNLGRLGERPSHPDLLDWLASELIRRDWSLKQIERLILQSSTWAQSSRGGSLARIRDPENQRLHHMPLLRLDAEQLRDSILTVSGSLKPQLYGRGVAPFVSANATANKPGNIPQSGPLDGAGRRTLYLTVRRNFVTPFVNVFDFPDQGESVGRRNETTVAPQALSLLNGAFVRQQARLWGNRMAARPGSQRTRLTLMFRTALARRPTGLEVDDLARLLDEPNGASATPADWADVAHVLFNLSEFLYVR